MLGYKAIVAKKLSKLARSCNQKKCMIVSVDRKLLKNINIHDLIKQVVEGGLLLLKTGVEEINIL